MKPFRRRTGFTLIELLVVVAIIAILAALIMPAIASARRRGNLAREVSSAKQLMAAYHAYASDHDGELMPGMGDFPAVDAYGKEVHSPVNLRYPWRIAPYLQYDLRILWGSDSDDMVNKAAKGAPEGYHYAVSVSPALGANAAYVGGDYQSLPPNRERNIQAYGQYCVTRMGHATRPGSLIVFASAGSNYEGERLSGYFKVEAPYFTSRKWISSEKPSKLPEENGFVDFRWGDKAVAAMLDGHVELLDFAQMQDMRRWCNLAAEADDPDWKLGSSR